LFYGNIKNMELLYSSVIILIISQTSKLVVYLLKGEKFSMRLVNRSYVWSGGFPSTHTAILVGAVYFVWLEFGMGLFFSLSVLVAGFFIYELLEDYQHQKMSDAYLKKSDDPAVRKMVRGGKLWRLSGHSLSEITGGAILGFVVAFLFLRYIV
jgi:acid phosphatase family membrane protein YuiD